MQMKTILVLLGHIPNIFLLQHVKMTFFLLLILEQF